MLKKIKTQLHKWLFPSYENKIRMFEVMERNSQESIKFWKDKLKESESKPKSSIADLMRDSLKLITIDFTHQERGVPNHFLNLPDTLDGRDTRKMYISQLAQIQQLEVWDVLMKYLIDAQGNYTIRLAPTDMEVFAGRMMIAGISLVRDEVKSGNDEFMDGSKPKEDFDPTDHSTEGISYTSDEKDEL